MTYLVDLKDLKGLNDFREPFSKKINDCNGCPVYVDGFKNSDMCSMCQCYVKVKEK